MKYARGEGIDQDLATAVRWYLKAAEQGHAEAQYHLGYSYEHGEGVPADLEQAKTWYRKAAAQGEENAQERLRALER